MIEPRSENAVAITQADVLGTLRSLFTPRFIVPNEFRLRVCLTDEVYQCVDPDWVQAYAKLDGMLSAGPIPGNPEVFDCDDFAFYLKTQLAVYAFRNTLPFPLAVGCLIMPAHAFNFCIGLERNFHLINTHSVKKEIASDPLAIADALRVDGSLITLVYV